MMMARKEIGISLLLSVFLFSTELFAGSGWNGAMKWLSNTRNVRVFLVAVFVLAFYIFILLHILYAVLWIFKKSEDTSVSRASKQPLKRRHNRGSNREDRLVLSCLGFVRSAIPINNQPATVSSELTEAHLKEFEVSARAKFHQDFKKLLENKVSCADVKIITKDKQEFVAQWGILAARSSFFENLYHSKMKKSLPGIIDLPDISGKSFEVLRNFIYTGELLEYWKEDEVIPELVNAAAKYMLSDLLKFLDNALGDLCDSQNAVQLLLLAQKYSLKNAEEDILDWIKENATNTADSFLALWSNLTNKTGNNEGS